MLPISVYYLYHVISHQMSNPILGIQCNSGLFFVISTTISKMLLRLVRVKLVFWYDFVQESVQRRVIGPRTAQMLCVTFMLMIINRVCFPCSKVKTALIPSSPSSPSIRMHKTLTTSYQIPSTLRLTLCVANEINVAHTDRPGACVYVPIYLSNKFNQLAISLYLHKRGICIL